MGKPVKHYWSDEIEVTYEPARCIHVAECLRSLPEVFDTSQRPWVQPGNANADEVAETVRRCPSGALKYTRKDGGAAEAGRQETTIWTPAASPLYLRGDFRVEVPGQDEPLEEHRATLCRCGISESKPFCDNSHRRAGFDATGDLGESRARTVSAGDGDQRLRVTPLANGPLRLRGSFRIVGGHGRVVYQGNRALLCRCGHSANKPFCDDSHVDAGFQADGV